MSPLEYVKKEREAGKTIYPADENIFRAVELCPPKECRCLVIGQDPYHEAGQANGLAFSVDEGVRIPPSLRNIFKELRNDIGCDMPKSGDLTPWAKQGVLLLTTVLTVEEGKANSHKDIGWQKITMGYIREVINSPTPTCILLWGKQAVSLLDGIDLPSHKMALKSTHPSPLSANRGSKDLKAFIGSRPFSKVNQFLVAHGSAPINWELA